MNTQLPPGDSPQPERLEELDRLVVECLGRVEREGLVALLALCAEYPEHSIELRRRIGRLLASGLLELVLSTASRSSPGERRSTEPGSFTNCSQGETALPTHRANSS